MTGPFTVRKHLDGDGAVRIFVSGEIDHDVSGALTNLLLNAVEQPGVTALTVDLADVTFLGSTGVRSLLTCRREASRRGCGFHIVNPQELVLDVLRAARVVKTLSVTLSSEHEFARHRAMR